MAQTVTCKAMVMWENGADLVEETIQVRPPQRHSEPSIFFLHVVRNVCIDLNNWLAGAAP